MEAKTLLHTRVLSLYIKHPDLRILESFCNKMSRGGSHGGGQSSLGYLFGSEELQPNQARTSLPVIKAPWGDDNTTTAPTNNPSNNYHRAQGQNSGNFLTDRPTTRVLSAPGGESSLGYLFGDK